MRVLTYLAGDAATSCFGVKGYGRAQQGRRSAPASAQGIDVKGR